MSEFKEKLIEALEAKKNDTSTFVWKLAKKSDGTQEEMRLIDATAEQLQQFYNHCVSMLYSEDRKNPGRYTLLKIISDQRNKCNTELLLRKLESGVVCADGKPYPRYLYLQDINSYMSLYKEDFPTDKLNTISISSCTGGLPREFERVSIADVIDACLDKTGILDTKHITFNFILNIGVYLTPDELKEFNEKDLKDNNKKKPEMIKEKLGLKKETKLMINPSGGLSFKELRAMLTLRPKKYRDLTTDQLTTLRDKVLFRLEDSIKTHISQWEERMRQIKLVAKEKNIELNEIS